MAVRDIVRLITFKGIEGAFEGDQEAMISTLTRRLETELDKLYEILRDHETRIEAQED